MGSGKCALDITRVLSKTGDEFLGSDIVAHALEHLKGSAVRRITILGRRGPHQIAMTPQELGELGHLKRAVPHVDSADLPDDGAAALLDPGVRKSGALLRPFSVPPTEQPNPLNLDFFSMTVAHQ